MGDDGWSDLPFVSCLVNVHQ